MTRNTSATENGDHLRSSVISQSYEKITVKHGETDKFPSQRCKNSEIHKTFVDMPETQMDLVINFNKRFHAEIPPLEFKYQANVPFSKNNEYIRTILVEWDKFEGHQLANFRISDISE